MALGKDAGWMYVHLTSDIADAAVALVSPDFTLLPGAPWRQEIEMVWGWLGYFYTITERNYRSTQIHVSLGQSPLTCTEFRQLAQAVVHFEPAFEVLTGVGRRSNRFAKSNWADSHYLAQDGRSRADSIVYLSRESRLNYLVTAMHGSRQGNHFAWGFDSLAAPGYHEKWFTYRKPPAATSGEEVLAWAELTVTFIQAALACPGPEALQRVPATIGGLTWFTRSFKGIPGANDPRRLLPLWRAHKRNETAQPLAVFEGLEGEKKMHIMTTLQRLVVEERRLVAQTKTKEPYWN